MKIFYGFKIIYSKTDFRQIFSLWMENMSHKGSPGSLPWMAWADNFGGYFRGQRGSPSGVPGAIFCNPGVAIVGHIEVDQGGLLGVAVTCHRCGRGVPLRGGSVGSLMRGRGGLLMGGRGELVWEAQGMTTWEARKGHFILLGVAICIVSSAQFRLPIFGGSAAHVGGQAMSR